MAGLSPPGRALLCAFFVLCLVFAAQGAGLLQAWERQTWDARVRLLTRPATTTDQIRIIALDQSSLDWGARENGLSWPWPREVYGLILDFCRRAGATTVSFDVIFSEPSLYGVEDDLRLGQAGAANGRLILALTPAGGAPPAGGQEGARPPVAAIASGAAGFGTVNELPDPDGIFRAMRLVSPDGQPSLALAAYRLARGERESTAIPLDAQGRAILNFRGGHGAHAAYSAAAIIQSELRLQEGEEATILPEALRGRHVFFGFTAPALLDLRPSPTDGAFAGVELHATALDNLLADDFFRPAPPWAAALAAICLSLGAAVFVLRATHVWQLFALAPVFLFLPVALSLGAYRALYWLPLVPVWLSVFLSLASAVALAYVTEGRQRRFLKSAFNQYLSSEVINQIIKEPDRLKLGGERRVLSIYFSDLASFSAISEHLSPEDLTRLLNEYLSLMSDIILEEGGTIDKYQGDAIIAFWNAPQEQPDHAARALRAALRCHDALAEHQERFRAIAGQELVMRVGLNTGPAVVGNMGSRSRFDYTMLGDAVNLASRLEGANKEFGTRTLVSWATFEAAGNAFAGRELGLLRVVGRKEATRVLEPMWPEQAAAKSDPLRVFAAGIDAFRAGHMDEAMECFARIATADPAAAAYLERCAALPRPLPQDWSGVWELSGK